MNHTLTPEERKLHDVRSRRAHRRRRRALSCPLCGRIVTVFYVERHIETCMGQLHEKQVQFTKMTARLIDFAFAQGFELTYGEVYRTPEQAQRNAIEGRGIAGSLHCDRMAVDFQLFKDGVYLTRSEDYLTLGLYWESLGGSWGGRFLDDQGKPKPDGNHFSLAFGGRK